MTAKRRPKQGEFGRLALVGTWTVTLCFAAGGAGLILAQSAAPRGVREAAVRQAQLQSQTQGQTQAPAQASSLPPNPATVTLNHATQNGYTGSTPPVSVAAAGPARLELQYVNGQMTVDASDADLNQILREIATKTGMKVTGGVVDQKVFGHYGPGTVGTVLASLLDGTGANMMLVGATDGSNAPSELILSSREGGATPPSPLAGEAQPNNAYAERQGRGSFLGARADGGHAVAPPGYQPSVQEPSPEMQQPAQQQNGRSQAGDAVDGAPSGGQSPNGTKTPLEIYQELQKMRQNATQPAPATPPQ